MNVLQLSGANEGGLRCRGLSWIKIASRRGRTMSSGTSLFETGNLAAYRNDNFCLNTQLRLEHLLARER